MKKCKTSVVKLLWEKCNNIVDGNVDWFNLFENNMNASKKIKNCDSSNSAILLLGIYSKASNHYFEMTFLGWSGSTVGREYVLHVDDLVLFHASHIIPQISQE